VNKRDTFLINLMMAVVWGALQENITASGIMIGFVVSFLVLSVIYRGYATTILGIFGYFIFMVWSIIIASFQVAGYVLSPQLKLDQGIVEVPLDVRTDLETALLASSITLTPGTISIHVGRNQDGERVLYVHNLVMGDPDNVRRTIKQDFERRILLVTRGGAL
jgi:multicomponent Na+:H+ antiporter subunit E